MGIILLILKIIGITLLAILLFILLVLALLLFVPFRYSAKGSFKGKLQVEAKVTYLLHLIRVTFTTDLKSKNLSVKVLFFELLGKKNKNESNLELESEKTVEESKEQKLQSDSPKIIETVSQEKETIEHKTQDCKTQDSKTQNYVNHNHKGQNPNTGEVELGKTKSQKADKSKNAPVEANKQDSVFDKIKSVVSLIKENEKLIGFLFIKLKKLFKHVLPGQFRVNLKLGLDDPATLGEILGAAAIIRSATNFELNIVPYFDEKILEAEFDLKGRIRLFTILWIGITTYFNKDMRKLIKKLRRS